MSVLAAPAKERSIAKNSNTKSKAWPAHNEMSTKRCSQCDEPIKLKHIIRANDNAHRPPDLCYFCLAKVKGKKTSRERKIELAKKRAREREAAKKGLSGG